MNRSSVIRGRRWWAVLLAGVTAAASTLVFATPSQADDAVSIPDVNFLNCLDSNLAKADGASVTAAELASLTQLFCDGKGIVDLTGVGYLTNVVEYYLANNSITNIGGLNPSMPVSTINVSNNKIADLSPLGTLTGAEIYADGQTLELKVVVGQQTPVGITGRSGTPISHLTPADTWAALAISGSKVTLSEPGFYEISFSDPLECSTAGVCVYTFNGVVTVQASAEFTATPAPTISGTAEIGETLTAQPLDWTPAQLDWSYQWYRNDVEISGAVASTYLVTADDAGWGLKVAVTGILDGYSSPSVRSQALIIPGKPFATATRPEITGTATVGQTLTAEVSGWTPTPDDWTYQWRRNGDAIAGATQSSYLLSGSDAGAAITVTVTGTKALYRPTSQTSNATQSVAAGTFQTVVPAITGTVQVGRELTATAPGWSPIADHWDYQWYRNNKVIANANKPSYTPVASDVKATITVRMTATKLGYTTAAQTSAPTPKVKPGLFVAPAPKITGVAKPGHKLKVVLVGWSPKPSTVHRQWYRDGKKIAKATKSTYRLRKSDRGHHITVRVIAAKKGYVTVKKMSPSLRITR